MIQPTDRPKAYWWASRPNFGDALAPFLIHRFCPGIYPEHTELHDAQILSIGSVLDRVKPSFQGIVCGSGMLSESSHPNLCAATILAVRGPLTAERLVTKQKNFVLGDPGLLASDLIQLPYKQHNLGLVPHWSDTTLEKRKEFLKFKPLIIRVSKDPLEVVRQIASCKKIVSSSLHGIIVADAFHIPRRIEIAPRFLSAPVEGGDFKLRDYHKAIHTNLVIGKTILANYKKIQDCQSELFDCYSELYTMLRGR